MLRDFLCQGNTPHKQLGVRPRLRPYPEKCKSLNCALSQFNGIEKESPSAKLQGGDISESLYESPAATSCRKLAPSTALDAYSALASSDFSSSVGTSVTSSTSRISASATDSSAASETLVAAAVSLACSANS